MLRGTCALAASSHRLARRVTVLLQLSLLLIALVEVCLAPRAKAMSVTVFGCCIHSRARLSFSACSMLADDLKLSSDDDDGQKVCTAFSFPSKAYLDRIASLWQLSKFHFLLSV